MEYICESSEHQRVLLVTDIHYCEQVWNGATREQRTESLCRALNLAYSEDPYDMILCLGDYSLDFWAWAPYGSYLKDPPVSNTRRFLEEVAPRFPLKPYLIPGNHEQYGHEDWEKLTGFPRQYTVVYGDYVFLMCDTFGGDLDPKVNSDGTYTGIDPAFLKDALERHPDRQIILCMHDLVPEKESPQVRQMIVENPRILCAFAGHIHQSHVTLLGEAWRNLPLIYCGDFSYSIEKHPNSGYQYLDFSHGFETGYKFCSSIPKDE